MMFKKEKDLDQLKQALQEKTESCEKDEIFTGTINRRVYGRYYRLANR